MNIERKGKIATPDRKLQVTLPIPGDLSGRLLLQLDYAFQRNGHLELVIGEGKPMTLSLEHFSVIAQALPGIARAVESERQMNSLPERGSIWRHHTSGSRIVIEELVDNGRRALYHFERDSRRWTIELSELRADFRAEV